MTESGRGTPRQLTLDVQLDDDATLENFCDSEQTAPLLALLRDPSPENAEPLIYLHGSADSGKSHLLQAACQQAAAGTACYLPLLALRDYPAVDVLASVEGLALVCIDDLQAVAGEPEWEQALFDVVNRCRASGCQLLFAATASPRELGVKLPDLQSRLSWGVTYRLPAADDQRRQEILTFRAAQRGLKLAPEVLEYILARAPRGLAALMALLNQLDAASLQDKRALSRPFVKQVLGW